MPATLLDVVVVGAGGGSGDNVVPTGTELVVAGALVGLKENFTVREGVVWMAAGLLVAWEEGV